MGKTAWGEVKMNIAEASADGNMPASLSEIGDILEESLTINKEDGTKLQLFKEGHILFDELQQEPTISLGLTLIGISDENKGRFWDAAKTGTGSAERFVVKSLINNKKFAIEFAAIKVPGSDTFEAPYCTVSMGPLYSSTQGWTAELEITIIRSAADILFQFGKVPTV